jgi:phosphonate transport system substrate-binding protein
VRTPILVGAVVYDPKVVVIWDIIKDFFEEQGYPIDYVFYSNYELQVDALLAGHIDIAWNSPLAWVDAQRRTHRAARQHPREDRRPARTDRRDGRYRFPAGDAAPAPPAPEKRLDAR